MMIMQMLIERWPWQEAMPLIPLFTVGVRNYFYLLPLAPPCFFPLPKDTTMAMLCHCPQSLFLKKECIDINEMFPLQGRGQG